MRITGGEIKGRKLKTPPGEGVRPTQDSVREALFSMLGLAVPDCSFLDLFGGSGAVGIEAWSRGASRVTWVESDRRNARLIKSNADELCGGAGNVVNEDVFRFLARPARERYELVFADPPYADGGEGVDDRIPELMALLASSGIMAENGIFIAEQRAGTPMPTAKGFARIKDRRYGHTRITLFRFIGAKPASGAAAAEGAPADSGAAAKGRPAEPQNQENGNA